MAVTQELADALRSCGSRRALASTRALHGRLVTVGLASAVFLQNTLLHAYLSCGALPDARRLLCADIKEPNVITHNIMMNGYAKLGNLSDAADLFDRMPTRDVASWNTLMSGYFQAGRFLDGLETFVSMHRSGDSLPNSFTFCCVMKSCGGLGWRELPPQLLGLFWKFDFWDDPDAETALVDMFYGCFSESVELFNQMRAELMAIDQFAMATLISGCFNRMDLCLGRQLHSLCLKSGHNRAIVVSNSLISLYAKCGDLQNAEFVFSSMSERDIVSWTSMITAYSQVGNISKARQFFDGMATRNVITWNAMLGAYIQHGAEEDGLKMYSAMLSQKDVTPDWVTYVTLFRGCADIGANKLGDQIIGHTVKAGLILDVSVANAAITMYSKCGRISEAQKLFDLLNGKDLVSWNAMITGYSQHGMGKQAVKLFDDMLSKGVKPDYISYVAVLSGCSHSGLVQEGKLYFDMATRVHDISPGLEHFSCMVDLLGRAGHLTEAKDLIDKMPMKPTAEVWGALLSACKIHGNNELAELAAKHLFELDSPDSGSYMLLAKIYSDAGKSDDSAQVRKLMRDKGIKKNPGYSWMEVENKVHVFKADDVSHPQVIAIRNKLDELMEKIAHLGYVRTESPRSKIHHSEKLAVAFGIMSLPAWMPIHIMKNLRICGDCHTVIKLISSVTDREFVIRDAVRFHHFKSGACSCGDYW
ncbi:hypothetical protein E2562_039104 [Oryza meyeriana var. granulata]|uniref:DYW domain-containing protein n=1 Tax=Oryza meyeriana var. granulata TaxID=110450 RepID=A0A6G1C2L4_9ORYZ|nr:hypothetical protein E2562_039104 [Oryza meyeriana var. granulata]